MKVALTGASGNMGKEVLSQILEIESVKVNALITPKKKNDKYARKIKKLYGDRITIIRGYNYQREILESLIKDCDMVVNMAAVIPPRSDKSFENSYKCNELGTITLTDVIEESKRDIKFIHISTVALYGSRTLEHPFGRVGDPLLVSPFDAYAMHKLRGERYVLESNIKHKCVLRQTGMLYQELIFQNISDGLLYHTVFNCPLEWVTARDSGLLLKNIVSYEIDGKNDRLWGYIYDICGGVSCRQTGYEIFNEGFKIMGGSVEKYIRPNECATRNFHGVWYSHGSDLNDIYHYQRESVSDFWNETSKKFAFFKLAKILPPCVIRLLVFARLLNSKNSPYYWVKKGDNARVIAYFGSMENAKKLPKTWHSGLIQDGNEYLKNESDLDKIKHKLLSHGYDDSKDISDWNIDDVQSAVTFRGGKLLSTKYEGAYSKMHYQCAFGHNFSLTPFSVLKGGHWCDKCMPMAWSFDVQAKKMPYYSQVWYDSHDTQENYIYNYDENVNACLLQE